MSGFFYMQIDPYQITYSREILKFLKDQNISILFSTYQAGRVMVLGTLDGEVLHQIPVSFKKPMGIAIHEDKIAIACLDEVQVFGRNKHVSEQQLINSKRFDTYYINRLNYNTSSLDVHDLDFGENKIWGVNTSFSCLCTFDISGNFTLKWKPSFIKEVLPEDRCHLNGMAMKDGLPRYVTALSQTDSKEGWRADIMNTGVLMAVPSSEVILSELPMPHSPRFYKDDLFVLTSGNGCLLKVNVEDKSSEVYYNFGKFLRGLCFHGQYAIIGTSKIRETSKTFNGLDVKNNSKNAGIIVFDMEAKKVIAEVMYENTIDEIFDVQVLTDTLKPAILTNSDERSKQVIVFANQVFWRKSKED